MVKKIPRNIRLRGLGGWLVLVNININVIHFLWLISTIVCLSRIFGQDNFDFLLNDAIPNVVILAIYEGMVNFLFLFGYTYLMYLFYSKNYKTPKVFITLLSANVILVIINMFVDGILFDQFTFDAETIITLVPKCVCSAIWIPYFLCSVRVKNTFIRGKPKDDSAMTNQV